MSRPPKMQRVDYFPHMCIHGGKTLFILEQKYREKGYTFWFKLLEKLGSTIGHALDLSDPAEWELLQARSFSTTEECEEIIGLLVRLKAIDEDLWTGRRIIWCQNFVDNLSDVYRKRNCALPLKPGVSGAETTGEAGFPAQKPEQGGVSGAESAARIGQERIGQERIGQERRGERESARENGHAEDDPPTDQDSHSFGLFKSVMPLRGGKFLQEDECREEWARVRPMQRQITAAAKNYRVSREVADGAVTTPLRFIRGRWKDWQQPDGPLGTGPPAGKPDYSWREERDQDEAVLKRQVVEGFTRPSISDAL